ncbi:CMRF35-like molecule 5 isoform X2 [Silurus meridionalis]|nr:CMRF35-like molecule 5 isoform X2 [Silurus meridionalis]
MKILLIFNFCLIIAGSDAVTTVTGYRGRSVQIKCHYESGYEKNNKYLCRGECPPWPAIKDIPVQSGSPAEDTRFSLYDNTTAKIFTITITDLRAEDANTYWCVVQQKGPNIYTELQLLVVDDPARSSVSPSTHTTYSASPHITSPSVHTETPPATVTALEKVEHKSTADSSNDVPGLTTYLLLSTGAVVFTVGVMIAIYCKRNRPGPGTMTQSSKETSDVYENCPNFNSLQETVNTNLPKSECKTPDPTTEQSDTIYQNSSNTDNQSNSVYQNLTVTKN